MGVIPTLHWQSNIVTFTEGLLAFGATDVPGRAHPIVVNDDGELTLGHLPPETVANTGMYPKGGYTNFPAEPSKVSQIFGHGLGKMETSGINPSNAGRLTIAVPENFQQGFDLISPTREYELPTALVVQPAPKVYPRSFVEFQGKYYTGSGGIGTSVSMLYGTHNAGNSMATWRFTRGALTFRTDTLGTPPNPIYVRLYVTPYPGSAGMLQREWAFDVTSWANAEKTKILRFDVICPYITVTISTTGTDASNWYRIDEFFLNLFSV